MALEASFQELDAQLRILQDAVSGLRVTIVEDRPLHGDVALVDTLGDAAEDLLGWIEESLAAATEGQQAVGHPTDLDRARRALTACQERFNRITHHLSSDLASYERIDELMRLGRERGGEWHAWSRTAKEGLDRCWQPTYDLSQALFRCWQEIAERVGMTSVSVQATNVGQQLIRPESRESARERVP